MELSKQFSVLNTAFVINNGRGKLLIYYSILLRSLYFDFHLQFQTFSRTIINFLEYLRTQHLMVKIL